MKVNHLIIVKVGTNTLLKHREGMIGELDAQSFKSIGEQIRSLADTGYKIILVSSGAISAGAVIDGRHRNEVYNAVELQRFAARGWDHIVQKWKEVIGHDRISSALLTKREIHDHKMRAKVLEVIDCCLRHNDIFLVNENDVISDDEIKFGDNDRLAAELAVAVAETKSFEAISLVLLTDKDGLNKVADDDETIIKSVINIDDVEQYAGTANGVHSRGGMQTKIIAARIATNAGVNMYIANGRKDSVLGKVLKKTTGTHFIAKG